MQLICGLFGHSSEHFFKRTQVYILISLMTFFERKVQLINHFGANKPDAIFAIRRHCVSADQNPRSEVPGYYSERGVPQIFLQPVFPRFCLANFLCFSLLGAFPLSS